MKTVVFGGTGQVGRIIVDKLVAQGEQVRVLTRQAKEHVGKLQYISGNVLVPQDVEGCIEAGDKVIIALSFANSDKDTMSRGTANIIAAMQKKDAKQLVCLSSHGVGESWAYLPEAFKEMVAKDEILQNAFNDHILQEDYIKSSGLDWTIVHPTEIVDTPEKGTFSVNGWNPNLTWKISKKDVAQFIVDESNNPKYTGNICMITD